MPHPDLNLLVTLDVLLAEGSVARAARRLRLSPSAMSRALARLRAATGDPLLVPAGRALVPTPRAVELRDRVRQVVDDATAILRPAERLDLARLRRTFTLRVSDGFVESFGPALVARLRAEAPNVRLRFVPKADRESAPLRDGTVDLDTGVVGQHTGPELRARALFRDRFVGVVHAAHPLARGEVTAARYVAERHVAVSRRGIDRGPVEDALAAAGLSRDVAVTVSGFAAALAMARASALVATVPERHTASLRADLHAFALPFPTVELTVSLLWHPRHEADAAHRWLRACVHEVCSAAAGAVRPATRRARGARADAAPPG